MRQMWHEVPHVCDHSYETGQLLLVYEVGVISVIPCVFLGQGCMTSVLYSTLKNETLGHLSSNFLLFSTSPSIWATLRRLLRLASWSSSETPYTTMSSWMLMTPGHLSMMRSIFIWKTSCDILAPKGILLNLYQPL